MPFLSLAEFPLSAARKPNQRRLRTLYPPPDPLPEHELLGGLDDHLARFLWRAVRDITGWIADPKAVRPDEGAAASTVRETVAFAIRHTPDLEEAYGAFAGLRLSPQLATSGQIAAACEQVYRWTDAHGMRETALLFAETWARVDPDNPIPSNEAGRAARRTAYIHRAEVWLHRAYKLAARHKNRREKIRALIGLGGLLRELGRHAEAQQQFFDAARLAQSTRRHRQAAEVQHELLTIAAESGAYREAEHFMRAALDQYPIHHRALPWLAHDWAFFLVRNALYREARVLLEAARPHVLRKELEVVVAGTLGRAAAGCGIRGTYEECSRRVLALCTGHDSYAAAALAHLAVGAQFFGDWETGELFATRAVQLARARRQEDVERGASEILTAIRSRQPATPQAEPPQPNEIAAIERLMLARL